MRDNPFTRILLTINCAAKLVETNAKVVALNNPDNNNFENLFFVIIYPSTALNRCKKQQALVLATTAYSHERRFAEIEVKPVCPISIQLTNKLNARHPK